MLKPIVDQIFFVLPPTRGRPFEEKKQQQKTYMFVHMLAKANANIDRRWHVVLEDDTGDAVKLVVFNMMVLVKTW